MIRPTEIAWLAGFLEGEGTFIMSERSIAVVVPSIDRDVIDHAATLLGGHVYAHPRPSTDRPRKPVWRAQVKGPRAAGWMMTIYPMLGARRREQVRRATPKWRAMRYVRVSPLVERSIVSAWTAGGATKSGLARRFGVSRETIYNVLQRAALGDGFVREPGFARVSPIDIAWLAGLVEGEGNISVNAPDARRKPTWLAQVKGSTAAGWAMTLYPWLGIRRRQQVRDALAHWKQQGNGVIGRALADAIVVYRRARLSQAEIMSLLRVGKSTVYRHTRGRLPRIRVVRREVPSTPSALDPGAVLGLPARSV